MFWGGLKSTTMPKIKMFIPISTILLPKYGHFLWRLFNASQYEDPAHSCLGCQTPAHHMSFHPRQAHTTCREQTFLATKAKKSTTKENFVLDAAFSMAGVPNSRECTTSLPGLLPHDVSHRLQQQSGIRAQ